MKRMLIREIYNDLENMLYSDREVTIEGRILNKRNHKNVIFFDIIDKSSFIPQYEKRNIEYKLDENYIIPFRGNLLPLQMLMDKEKYNHKIHKYDMIKVVGKIRLNDRKYPIITPDKIKIEGKFKNSALQSDSVKSILKVLSTGSYRMYSYGEDIISLQKYNQFYSELSDIETYLSLYFTSNGFIRVRTPTLTKFYTGGFSLPFETKTYNNNTRFLRTTLEHYLRASLFLFEDVYDFGRSFRNERETPYLLQEFTLLEGYSKNVTPKEKMSELLIIEPLISLLERSGIEEIEIMNPVDAPSYISSILSKTVEESFKYGRKERGLFNFYSILPKVLRKDTRINEIDESSIMIYQFSNIFDEVSYPLSKSVKKYGVSLSDDMLIVGVRKISNSDRIIISDVAYVCNEENSYAELYRKFSKQGEVMDKKHDINVTKYKDSGNEELLKILELGLPDFSGIAIGIEKLYQLLFYIPDIRNTILK